VIAIEPTGVIDCLRLNLQLNGLKNVTAIRAAVGRAGQQLDMVEYPGFNIVTHQAGIRPAALTRFFIRLLYGKYRSEPVHTTTACLPLAEIMDENQVQTVDFLKMDCEGGEYEIFRSMEPDHWQRIRRIALEFHELGPDQRHGELVAILKKAGFEVEIRKPFLDYYCMKFGEIWAQRR
jgi:FkbM family methyltransferase